MKECMKYLAKMSREGCEAWTFTVTADSQGEAQERAQRTADALSEGWTCQIVGCSGGDGGDDWKEWA